MKKLLRYIPYILVILIAVLVAFALGADYGKAVQLEHDKKVIEASIKVKKKHSKYHVEYPIQEYNKEPIPEVSI